MSNLSTSEMTNLRVIEDEVNEYLKSKQTNPEKCIGINSALNRIIPRYLMPTKKISIIWNNNAREPFIMSITPDISELYSKMEKMNNLMNDAKSKNSDILNEWADISQWYIEIDTRVLTKNNRLCVDDGSQFVALLCHEIGHVMNENPMRLFRNYKKKAMEFSTMERLMLSNSKIVRSIMLPMYTHTLQFMIVARDRNDNKDCELAADAYVPEAYKGALVSYMNNHLLLDPSANKLVIDQNDFDNEQEIGIRLSKESITMLKGRRDVLNRQIQNQYNSDNSGLFHKKLMKFIGRNLTGYDPDEDKYITGLKTTMENAYNREYESMESLANIILTENAKVTSRELDVLDVQVDTIQTPEDKMYMIHKVYDYIEAIDKENSKKIKGNNAPKQIKDIRLDRLNAIRARILSTNVSETGERYGVFVKYPAGYEG